MQKHVLTVALDKDASGRIEPILRRRELVVERATLGAEACSRCAARRFDLVLVRYPLPDIMMRTLVDELRAGGSPSRDAPLLILTIPDMQVEAKLQVEGGPFRVLSQRERPEMLHEAVAQLLALAPRRAPRIVTRLRLDLAEGIDEREARVVNVSASGMLVDGAGLVPVATRCSFEFSLDRESRPIRGRADVVRHTRPGREKVRGFAVAFNDFEGEGAQQLAAGLRSLS